MLRRPVLPAVRHGRRVLRRARRPRRETPGRRDSHLVDQASCLGIAGITGYRALFADGPLHGLTVLVYGAAGRVGSIAVQMAVRDGARVIGIVRTPAQRDFVRGLGAHEVFLTGNPHLLDDVRKAAPDGVNRIAEVDFAGHIEFNARIIAVGATISSYYSADARPHIPYWPLGFADTNLCLLGSDDFAPEVKAHAAAELTARSSTAACRSPSRSGSPSTASPSRTNTSSGVRPGGYCSASERGPLGLPESRGRQTTPPPHETRFHTTKRETHVHDRHRRCRSRHR